MNTIYGIIIKTDTTITNTALGLYGGRFYWSEVPLNGLSSPYNVTWLPGTIARNGIGAIPQNANFERGGNTPNIGTFQIRIDNTQNIIAQARTLGIPFTGSILELVEFCGSDEFSDLVSATKVLSGSIEDISGDETTCTLTVTSSLARRRRANIATVVNSDNRPDIPSSNDGKIIPVVFGESDPANGRYFKAVKTEAKSMIYTVRELFDLPTETTPGQLYFPYSYSMFPSSLYNNLGAGPYTADRVLLRVGHLAYTLNSYITDESVVGKYVVCKEGDSENVGQYRKIIDIVEYSLDSEFEYGNAYILLELSDYLPVPPSGNWAATDVNQSYFEIVDALAEYEVETTTVGGFYDSVTGLPLTTDAEIYAPEDNGLTKLKTSEVQIVNSRDLIVNPRVFDSGPTSIKNYTILPITDIEPSKHTNWSYWDESNWSDAVRAVLDGATIDGVWVTNQNLGTDLTQTILANQGSQADRNNSTYYRFYNKFYRYPRYWVCLTFKLPEITSDVKFTNSYLLMNFNSTWTQEGSIDSPERWLVIKKRRYIGGYKNIVATKDDLADAFGVRNLPDSYVSTTTKNQYFYEHKKSSGDWSGYKTFDLEVSDKSEYDAIHEIIIIIHRNKTDGTTTFSEETRLYEIAVALETSADISSDLFVHYKGRKVGDTLIDNPISIIEHCLRYQNWSEKGTEQDWGHYYNTASGLIKTTGDGSFESTNLDAIKAIKCAGQILDYEKAWTDNLIKSLCQQFFLVQWQDGSGVECVDYLFREEPDADLIEYNDTKNPIGELERPKSKDVNCKPVIKYAYDQYTQKYTKELRINNVSESTFSTSFVSGFTGDDGEDIWDECRALFQMVGSIDDNNEGDIELPFVYRYEDALWVLQNRIKLMKKCRLPFSVAYETGKNWRVGKHLRLQLSHETGNEIKECIIEKLSINKNKDLVSVTVLIDDTEVAVVDRIMVQKVIAQSTDQWQENIGLATDQYQEVIRG